jgi:hypothetical protein
MATFRELARQLVDDPTAADVLRLADNYIQQMEKLGRNFALPSEHKGLKPLVDKYAKEPDEFVDFVKSIRDQMPPRGPSYVPVNELYHTLLVRRVQNERRARLRRALRWLEGQYPKSTTEQRQRWLRKLEQRWGRERLATMEEARRKTGSGRLSIAEREVILADFWKEIDDMVSRGELPEL